MNNIPQLTNTYKTYRPVITNNVTYSTTETELLDVKFAKGTDNVVILNERSGSVYKSAVFLLTDSGGLELKNPMSNMYIHGQNYIPCIGFASGGAPRNGHLRYFNDYTQNSNGYYLLGAPYSNFPITSHYSGTIDTSSVLRGIYQVHSPSGYIDAGAIIVYSTHCVKIVISEPTPGNYTWTTGSYSNTSAYNIRSVITDNKGQIYLLLRYSFGGNYFLCRLNDATQLNSSITTIVELSSSSARSVFYDSLTNRIYFYQSSSVYYHPVGGLPSDIVNITSKLNSSFLNIPMFFGGYEDFQTAKTFSNKKYRIGTISSESSDMSFFSFNLDTFRFDYYRKLSQPVGINNERYINNKFILSSDRSQKKFYIHRYVLEEAYDPFTGSTDPKIY